MDWQEYKQGMDFVVVLNAGIGFAFGAHLLGDTPFLTALGYGVVWAVVMGLAQAIIRPIVRRVIG